MLDRFEDDLRHCVQSPDGSKQTAIPESTGQLYAHSERCEAKSTESTEQGKIR